MKGPCVTPNQNSPSTLQGVTEVDEKQRADQGRTLTERQSQAWERELLSRLGITWSTLPAQVRLWGWLATAGAGLIAILTRFIGLNHPHQMVFDETYYVKGGYSLITYGYERDWTGEDASEIFVQGSDIAARTTADYVVHPPFGKWLIGFGQSLFGTDNGFGWRFATALAGVISVMLITRIALRMFRSVPMAFLAGLFMAIDGVGIVLSRTGILDNLLATFVLAGFWAVLKDRDWTRRRLAHRVAYGTVTAHGIPTSYLGPVLLWRPWLILAGTFIGLGCGVKWSAAYALAVFGILVFAWDTAAKKQLKVRGWFTSGIVTGGIPAFVNFIPVALVAYVGAWTSWFLNPNSFKRGWAENQRIIREDVPFDGLGDAVAEWIAYHKQMWEFHTGLDSPHTYQSQPWDWILQIRPVNFYWPPQEKIVQDCGAERCVQAINSVGNPAIWWLAAASLLVVIWFAFRHGDWRAWAILAGYGAMYLPWFNYIGRTIYQFYSVAFLPYVILALIFALSWVTDMLPAPSLSAIRKAIARRRAKEIEEDWTLALPVKKPRAAVTAPDSADAVTTPATPDAVTASSDESRDPTSPGEPMEVEGASGPTSEESRENLTTDSAPEAIKADSAPSDGHVHLSEPAHSDGSDEPSATTGEEEPADLVEDTNSASEDVPDDVDFEDDPVERAVLLYGGPDPLTYHLHIPSKKAAVVLGVTAGFAIVLSIFWMPLWTGMTIPYDFWRLHIWLPGWS